MKKDLKKKNEKDNEKKELKKKIVFCPRSIRGDAVDGRDLLQTLKNKFPWLH